jgi:hypothetical protein
MSQYIYRKNQDILWNVVQIIPISPSLNRENMFKQTIKLFYDKNKHRKLTVNELRQLNKETIEYIILNYRFVEPISISTGMTTIPMRMQLMSTSQNTIHPVYPETKTQKSQEYSSELEYRQTEYTNMVKRDVPKEMNFLEKNEDTVIENMEELVAEYLKQRELDTIIPVSTSSSISIRQDPTPQNKVKIINNEIGTIDDIVHIVSEETIEPDALFSESEKNTNIYRRTFETERPKGASFQNVGGNLVANLNGVPFQIRNGVNKKSVQWDLSDV